MKLIVACMVTLATGIFSHRVDAQAPSVFDPFKLGMIPETGVWNNFRIPLNNPNCTFRNVNFNPQQIFNPDFVCGKDVQLPPMFPNVSVYDARRSNTDLFGKIYQRTYDYEHQSNNIPPDMYATEFFVKIFDSLKLDFEGTEFQQCYSKPEQYYPPQDAKYKVLKTCETKHIPLHQRAIWHTHEGRQYPCYIPVPMELYTVSCHNPDNVQDNRCRLGYAGYNEFRCVATNFVQKAVVVVCPDIMLMFKKYFNVPTACSCRMCYKCSNNISYDVRHNGPARGLMNGRIYDFVDDGIPAYAYETPLQKR